MTLTAGEKNSALRNNSASMVGTRDEYLLAGGFTEVGVMNFNDIAEISKQGLAFVAEGEFEKASRCHFLCGKFYERYGEYNKAFEHFRQANNFVDVDCDIESRAAQVKNTIIQYSSNYREYWQGRGLENEYPIFVIGMPFAGSHLIQTFFDSYPGIKSAGDSGLIEMVVAKLEQSSQPSRPYTEIVENITSSRMLPLGQYVAQVILGVRDETEVGEQAQRFVDFSLNNYYYVGFILDLFPHARFIHVSSDPRDVSLSCYFHEFDIYSDDSNRRAKASQFSYSYDPKNIGNTYLLYSRMMEHWKQYAPDNILDIQYDELVCNPEQQLKGISAFCGLEFKEGCAKVVTDQISRLDDIGVGGFTALDQMSFGKYTLNRWKNYSEYCEDLFETLSPLTTGTNGEISQLIRLAWWYQQTGSYEEAISCCEKVLKHNPKHIYANGVIARAAINAGEYEVAIAQLEKAIQLSPHVAEFYCNLGLARQETGDFSAAVDSLKTAVEIEPDFADAHWYLAMLEILIGHYSIGWERYEWRWRSKEFVSGHKNYRQHLPIWDGVSSLGLTLCVVAEQGVGDEIMFASCFHDLINRIGDFYLICDHRMKPLLRRSFSGIKFMDDSIKAGETVEPTAFISMGSLPGLFRKERSSFPKHHGYIRTDQELSDALRAKYLENSRDKLIVGVSWRGGAIPRILKKRSMDIAAWEKIFEVPNVTFVNLQYGDVREELEHAERNMNVSIVNDESIDPLKDMDVFSAQVAACDLVISTDNTTVHMAGSMGKPVWVLLSASPDFRWGLESEVTPWYPSVRLFRKNDNDNWSDLCSTVSGELTAFLAR